MKTLITLLLFIGLSFAQYGAYGKYDTYISNDNTASCVDYDGNVYTVLRIGDQYWTAENLRTTHYNDGTAIAKVTDNAAWSALSSGAYCWYDNDSTSYASTYGPLYNWYAIEDGTIAPDGWRVPTDAEWKQLEMYLGMSQSQADTVLWRGTDEGGKLKEVGTSHWNSPNTGATNTTMFTALPGGYRHYSGTYSFLGEGAYFCVNTEYDANKAWYRYLRYISAQVYKSNYGKKYGSSIRLVRDAP